MIQMIASKRFEHAGRILNAGDRFTANPRYVRVLEATHKARRDGQLALPDEGQYHAHDMRAESAPDPTPRVRRRYRRRDMRAEDTTRSERN